MIPASKSPQLQHRNNTGGGCIHQLLEGLSYKFRTPECSKLCLIFSARCFFCRLMWHSVTSWLAGPSCKHLRVLKGHEMSCPISFLQELRFIFLLLLKCASLKQKFDFSNSTLLAVYFSIFFLVVLIVKNALESRHCATLL